MGKIGFGPTYSVVKQTIEGYLAENLGNGAALLILDLDNLKQINDRYSRIQGDTMLIQTASVLSRSLR